MDPDEVDWYCDTREEEYWQYCQDKKDEKEATLMSEQNEKISAMVLRMHDEVEVTKDLDIVRDGLFRTQMTDAFCYSSGTKDGPDAYWQVVEYEWRKLTGGEPMPTKYRTNKSVILKAWRTDQSLAAWFETREKGVMGKSAVQAKCNRTITTKTGEGMARHIIHEMEQYRKKADAQDSSSCEALVFEWLDKGRS